MRIKMKQSYKGSYGLLQQGEEVDAGRIGGDGEAVYLIGQGHAVAVVEAKAAADAKKAEAAAAKKAKADADAKAK